MCLKIVDVTPDMRRKFDSLNIITDKFRQWATLDRQTFAPVPQLWKHAPDIIFAKYDALIARRQWGKAQCYADYNAEMRLKRGRQGGNIPLNDLKEIVKEYYSYVGGGDCTALYRGRDFLIDLIKDKVSRDYPLQYGPVDYYETLAGCPTGLHKGTFRAETEGASTWRHAYPTVPAYRYMRLKKRAIFGDSVQNVRFIERELSSVRKWLAQNLPDLFSAWSRPDIFMTPRVTEIINRGGVFIETDYAKMDMHFSQLVVTEVILPIYETLLDDGHFLPFASMVCELFSQPIFWGDELWCGHHNLLSGSAITNDFETIYSVVLYLSVALSNGAYQDGYCFAMGDDITMGLPATKYSITFADDMMKAIIAISNMAGLVIHDDEKSRVELGNTRFCRRVYYPGGVRDLNGNYIGAYPSSLAINNILWPERPNNRDGVNVIANIQRLDNVYGSPEFIDLCHLVRKESINPIVVDQSMLKFQRVDWWERVYGERWDPQSSRAMRILSLENI